MIELRKQGKCKRRSPSLISSLQSLLAHLIATFWGEGVRVCQGSQEHFNADEEILRSTAPHRWLGINLTDKPDKTCACRVSSIASTKWAAYKMENKLFGSNAPHTCYCISNMYIKCVPWNQDKSSCWEQQTTQNCNTNDAPVAKCQCRSFVGFQSFSNRKHLDACGNSNLVIWGPRVVCNDSWRDQHSKDSSLENQSKTSMVSIRWANFNTPGNIVFTYADLNAG